MLNFARVMDLQSGALKEIPVAEFLAAPQAEGLLWIDVLDPTLDDLDWLRDRFGFHPLALEDAIKGGQRPKIDYYEGYAYLDLYTGRFNETKGRLEMTEIDVFFGASYLVTLHRGPLAILSHVRDRWQHAEEARTAGSSFLLYLLLDTVVDDYFPMVDELEDQLEIFEESLFDRFDEQVIGRIFSLKKELLLFRKVVTPTRDVSLMLLRRESPLVSKETVVFLQDVYDHLIRVADSIDTYRDMVAGAIDAYLSVIANRTNDTMKRLTTISAVLMTVALVPAIYGMNFKVPEYEWSFGYQYAWALMLGLGVVLSLLFKALRYF